MKEQKYYLNDPGLVQLILSSAFKFTKPVKRVRSDGNPTWHSPIKTDGEVNYLFTKK